MESEIPSELIRELQIQLREAAGIPSYDTPAPSPSPLPSLRESIAQLDPSPPYLRCKNCSGRLLRGLQSIVCVYCGKGQRTELPPDPLPFKSTIGYRWFLESLGLDGSEIVGPPIEEGQLKRGKSVSKEELSVSDLLDFEIKWPTEEDKHANSPENQTALQSSSSVTLTGIDLDNFFAESKRETNSNADNEQLGPSTQIKSDDFAKLQVHEKPVLFDKVQPAEAVLSSSKDEKSGYNSGWEADFQTASGNTTSHEDSRSFDPFVGSNSDISAHMDTVFTPTTDTKSGSPKDEFLPPASMNHDDLWNDFNFSGSNHTKQPKGSIESNVGEQVANFDNPSSNVDWFEDNRWQTSTIKQPESRTISEDLNSLDDWNDFTSSSVPHHSNGSVRKSSGDYIDSGQNAENNLGEMDLGDLSRSSLFGGALNNQNTSKEVNHMQSGISVSDRTSDKEAEARGDVGLVGDISSASVESKSADVEMIMSQMHDLSFMLEDSLCIPAKPT